MPSSRMIRLIDIITITIIVFNNITITTIIIIIIMFSLFCGNSPGFDWGQLGVGKAEGERTLWHPNHKEGLEMKRMSWVSY